METILVHAENPQELKLVEDFLKKHNIKSRVLTDEDKEDILLSKMMEETNYDDTIPTDTFFKNLSS